MNEELFDQMEPFWATSDVETLQFWVSAHTRDFLEGRETIVIKPPATNISSLVPMSPFLQRLAQHIERRAR